MSRLQCAHDAARIRGSSRAFYEKATKPSPIFAGAGR